MSLDRIPLIIESVPPTTVDFLREALYNIGMGCQIMDDMVDLASDFHKKRHNYVLALIYHDSDPGEWTRLESRLAKSNPRRKDSNRPAAAVSPGSNRCAENRSSLFEQGAAGSVGRAPSLYGGLCDVISGRTNRR